MAGKNAFAEVHFSFDQQRGEIAEMHATLSEHVTQFSEKASKESRIFLKANKLG